MTPLNKAFSITLTLLCLSFPAQAWEAVPKPPAASPLAWVSLGVEMDSALWAASTHELFHAQSLSRPFSGWRDVSVITGPQKIKRLLPHTDHEIFILTDQSVFLWHHSSQTLDRIFTRSSESSASLLAFTTAVWSSPVWFAGTSEGLFISEDLGKTWAPHLLLGHARPISFLVSAGDLVFIRVENTLYRASSLTDMTAVYRFAEPDRPVDEEGAENESDAPVSRFEPVMLSRSGGTQLWLTSPQGLAESHDAGRHWALITMAGLTDQPIRALTYSEKNQLLFAAAGARIYTYHPSKPRWAALPQNNQGKILSLSLLQGSPENLLAASENGLMTQPIIPEQIFPPGQNLMPPEYESLFLKKIASEPSARAVQQAVVRYSNLTNSKIQRWHKESRLRALFPTFSFGRDFGSANTFDLDRGGTADPDRYISGPDDTNWGWDADVSWDLGDLIWSASQTSIDIREKLMVDQRRDFLAEAMRVYFERRRLQSELFFSHTNETRPFYEKQLRLEELTALLDALTGGWFSEQLQKTAGSDKR